MSQTQKIFVTFSSILIPHQKKSWDIYKQNTLVNNGKAQLINANSVIQASCWLLFLCPFLYDFTDKSFDEMISFLFYKCYDYYTLSYVNVCAKANLSPCTWLIIQVRRKTQNLFRVKSSIIKTTHAYFRKVKAKKNKEQRKNKIEKNHCNPEITAVKVTQVFSKYVYIFKSGNRIIPCSSLLYDQHFSMLISLTVPQNYRSIQGVKSRNSGSQPWLHSRITWEALKNHTQAPLQSITLEFPRVGAGSQPYFKAEPGVSSTGEDKQALLPPYPLEVPAFTSFQKL